MNELNRTDIAVKAIMKWVLILKIPIILAAFFLFFYMGYLGQFIERDSSASIDNILDNDDPAVLQNREFEITFGSNKNIIIALETTGIYQNNFLEFYLKLSDKLEDIEEVDSVFSLVTLSDIYGKEDQLIVEPFIDIDEMPYTSRQLQRMSEYFREHPFLANRIVDQAGKGIVISVQIDTNSVSSGEQEEELAKTIKDITKRQIEEVKREKTIDIKPHFVGEAIVANEISEIQESEGYIKNVMIVIFGIILLIIFRSFWGVVLPILIATTTISAIMGLKTLFHSTYSTIDGLLYALIFTISIADSIHIISVWYSKEYLVIKDKKERIIKIMQHVLVPCFFTSLTTAVGFGAIAISGIPQLRHFGLFASIAVIIAFFLTIGLIPSLLTLPNTDYFKKKIPENRKKVQISETKLDFLTRFNETIINAFSSITYRRANIIILVFAVFGIVAIVGIFKIKIGTNPYSFLQDSTLSNSALHFIEGNICGIEDFEVVLEKSGKEPFKEPTVLLEVENMQAYISGLEGVTQSNSIITFLKLLNKALHDGENVFYNIPETKDLVAQYLLLYGMSGDSEELNEWIDPNYNKLRLNFKVSNQANFGKIKKKIKSYNEKSSIPFTIYITGSTELWNKVDGVFLNSQVFSLLISISVISIILFIIFRSLRFGFYSLIVNLYPILIGFGILGFSGIGLNMGTVLIAPVAIGIAVDDTIHFIIQFKSLSIRENDLRIILNKVFKMLTKPIVFTSLILALGFGSNTISSFKPNGYFGFVAAVTLLVAMVTDLFLLPALIVFFKSSKR